MVVATATTASGLPTWLICKHVHKLGARLAAAEAAEAVTEAVAAAPGAAAVTRERNPDSP